MCWPFCVRSFMITALTPGSAGSRAGVSYARSSESKPAARFSSMPFSRQRRTSSSNGIIGMRKQLRPIKNVRRRHLQDAIRRALRGGLELDAIEDFLASVDWSGSDRERPAVVADALGRLEGATALYTAGDLTQPQYLARLLGFLPARERNRHLFVDGGNLVVTIVGQVDLDDELLTPQSAPRRPTVSDTRDRWVTGVTRSGIARVA